MKIRGLKKTSMKNNVKSVTLHCSISLLHLLPYKNSNYLVTYLFVILGFFCINRISFIYILQSSLMQIKQIISQPGVPKKMPVCFSQTDTFLGHPLPSKSSSSACEPHGRTPQTCVTNFPSKFFGILIAELKRIIQIVW